MNIVLCGMMGCGKTTVAKVFEDGGATTVDTDGVIVERWGVISEIFKVHGEKYFRDLEAAVVKEIAAKYDSAVIALGGGVVLREENVKNLKKTGRLFYLKARAETLIARMKGDTTRPLLEGNIEERVNGILAVRSGIYEGVADEIIETDGLTPEQIAQAIRERMQ